MNVNDPYIIAALKHWSGEPSTGDIAWRAADMRERDEDRAVRARAGVAAIRAHRGGISPDHRAIPTLSPGVCTCVRCGKPVRTVGPDGFGAIHART